MLGGLISGATADALCLYRRHLSTDVQRYILSERLSIEVADILCVAAPGCLTRKGLIAVVVRRI